MTRNPAPSIAIAKPRTDISLSTQVVEDKQITITAVRETVREVVAN
ncbi:MAG: hypothetical protein AAFO06_10055 [Cyanobacteria bacterium J06597_16]